jgi:hypothetical protein
MTAEVSECFFEERSAYKKRKLPKSDNEKASADKQILACSGCGDKITILLDNYSIKIY